MMVTCEAHYVVPPSYHNYNNRFDRMRQHSDVLEPVLTPDLTDIIQEVVDSHRIPGLALAVVRKNGHPLGHPEFGTWGKKSEDGSRVTEDVC